MRKKRRRTMRKNTRRRSSRSSRRRRTSRRKISRRRKVSKKRDTNGRVNKNLKGGAELVDKYSPRRIYVLFLAHEGVQQMEIWKKWREHKGNKENIIFVVADISGSTSENVGEKIYCVEVEKQLESSWGGKEHVVNTLYLFQRAVELAGDGIDGDLFWLVSGYCLPIIGSDKLTEFWAANPTPRVYKEYNDIKVGSQWMCLSRSNVDKICALTKEGILSYSENLFKDLPGIIPPDNYILQSVLPSNKSSMGFESPHWIKLSQMNKIIHTLLKIDGSTELLSDYKSLGLWSKNSDDKLLITETTVLGKIVAVMGTLGFSIKYTIGDYLERNSRPFTFRKVHKSYKFVNDDLAVLQQCWNDDIEGWGEFYNSTNKVVISLYQNPQKYEKFTSMTGDEMMNILKKIQNKEIQKFCEWSGEYVPKKSRPDEGKGYGEYGHLTKYFMGFKLPLADLPDILSKQEPTQGASNQWLRLFSENVERFLSNVDNLSENPVLRQPSIQDYDAGGLEAEEVERELRFIDD